MNFLFKLIHNLLFFTWDMSLTLLNLLTPSKRKGHVIPKNHPGYGGQWPEYIAPKEGDSRCACPALNALANHGIFPRDGKNIPFKEMSRAVRMTYNFAASSSYFVPHLAAQMLGKNYTTDTFDLVDLDRHNMIEHDASLIREDAALEPDQSKPNIGYITQLLSCASGRDKSTGEKILTIKDLSYFSSKRRADARGYNKEFSLDLSHKIFGSTNASTILSVFGGYVKDLETWLIEERIPDGWEPKVRQRAGMTMAQFNVKLVIPIELGINEKKYLLEKRASEEVAPNQSNQSDAGADRTAEVEEEAPKSPKLVDVQ